MFLLATILHFLQSDTKRAEREERDTTPARVDTHHHLAGVGKQDPLEPYRNKTTTTRQRVWRPPADQPLLHVSAKMDKMTADMEAHILLP